MWRSAHWVAPVLLSASVSISNCDAAKHAARYNRLLKMTGKNGGEGDGAATEGGKTMHGFALEGKESRLKPKLCSCRKVLNGIYMYAH